MYKTEKEVDKFDKNVLFLSVSALEEKNVIEG